MPSVAFPAVTGAGDLSSPQCMRLWSNPNILTGCFRSVAGNVIAYRWDLTTNTGVTIDLSTVASNEIELPFYIGTDAHYQMGWGADDTDHVHVIGNHHDNNTDGPPATRPAPKTGMHYLVGDASSAAAFTNTSNWVVPGGTAGAGDAEPGAALDNSADGATYTYQYFDRLSDGTLLLVQSQSYQRGVSIGRCVLGWTRKTGVNSGLWKPIGGSSVGTKPTSPALLMYTDHGATYNVEAQRAYCNGIGVVPAPGQTWDWIIFCGMWRTRDDDGDSQQKMTVIYCKSNDFTTWFDMAGNSYVYGAASYPSATRAMPLTWYNHSAALINGQPPLSGQGDFGQNVDPGTTTATVPGNIRVQMFNGDSVGGNTVPGTTLPTDTWLYYTWNGSTWVRTTCPNVPGAGRSFYIGSTLYVRGNEGAPRRVTLRNVTTSKVHGLGQAIASPNFGTGIIYCATPCPIHLREGKFITCVPTNDTPHFHQFPSGAHA